MNKKIKLPLKAMTRWSIISIFIWAIIMILFWWFLFSKIEWKDISEYTAILTADSLLTGATVTLIAFSNMSPSGSASSHIIKKCYWNSLDIAITEGDSNEPTCKERFMMFFAPVITPSFILIISFLATLFEIIILFIISRIPGMNEAALISLLFIMIFTTMFLLLSSVVRYVIFNHNPLKITSRYIQKIILENSTQFESSLYLLSYINGTKNFELLLVTSKKIKKFWNNKEYSSFTKELKDQFDSYAKDPYNIELRELTDLSLRKDISPVARLLIIFGSYSLISIKKDSNTKYTFSTRLVSYLGDLGKSYIEIINKISDVQFAEYSGDKEAGRGENPIQEIEGLDTLKELAETKDI